MKHRAIFSILILVTAFLYTNFAALANVTVDESAPAWLQQAAKITTPEFKKDVPAVVLRNEQSVNLSSDGMLTITTNYAVKLLTREGKYWADADALYLKSSSKVRSIKAWLIRQNGTVKYYGKDETLDRISDPDDIYDEYRVKNIDASDDADIGMVFGYETVVEERPLFTQDAFGFQGRLPVIYSRYSLNLPSGWQATSVTFNRAEIKPSITGSNYVWELRDMEPIPPEPDGLSARNLSPRIVVNYFPPNSNSHVYDTWRDVSKWFVELSSASLTLDDEVAAKARELTANSKTEFEKIRAIAEYVQSLRYISIDIGIARGGGYRPRPANLVLQRGYGDCKDKANLMRTMLKALKIESYLVLIYSGDPTFVKPEWASPRQFNHCIIAVRVSPETNAPTVMTHEKLGRLLIFDATDEYTQLGDLPEHEQGSYALVAGGADGDLLKMPILPADANKLVRDAEITLNGDGSISGKIMQKAQGQSASGERGRLKVLSASEYRTSVEQWLTRRVKGANLTKAAPTDRKLDNKFDLDIEFSAPAYAQLMQGRLMMFNPAMVGRLDQFTPVEGKRVTPILIDSSSYAETIKVKLPDNFVVDELPEPDKIETAYGKYSSKFEVAGGYLLFSRSLVLNRTVVPPSEYENVRNFFGVVRNAEQTPVVLVKK